jgi:hypothetical protein
MVFGKKKQPQQPIPPPPPTLKTSMVDADELMKGNISIEYLAEPFIIVQSGRTSMQKLVYAMNLISRDKDYRITDFSVTDWFAYVIMEKKTNDVRLGCSCSSIGSPAALLMNSANLLSILVILLLFA